MYGAIPVFLDDCAERARKSLVKKPSASLESNVFHPSSQLYIYYDPSHTVFIILFIIYSLEFLFISTEILLMFFHMKKYHSTVINMRYMLTNVHNDK